MMKKIRDTACRSTYLRMAGTLVPRRPNHIPNTHQKSQEEETGVVDRGGQLQPPVQKNKPLTFDTSEPRTDWPTAKTLFMPRLRGVLSLPTNFKPLAWRGLSVAILIQDFQRDPLETKIVIRMGAKWNVLGSQPSEPFSFLASQQAPSQSLAPFVHLSKTSGTCLPYSQFAEVFAKSKIHQSIYYRIRYVSKDNDRFRRTADAAKGTNKYIQRKIQ
jgi:hypothetical protein